MMSNFFRSFFGSKAQVIPIADRVRNYECGSVTFSVELKVLPGEGSPTDGQISVLQRRGLILEDGTSYDEASFGVALMKIAEEAMINEFGTMPRLAYRAVPILYSATDKEVFLMAEKAAKLFIERGQGGKTIREAAKMAQPVLREWAESL